MHTLLRLCACSLLLGLATVAEARPYTVVAHYGPTANDAKTTLTLAPDIAIPESATDRELRELAIHFEKKPFGLLPVEAFASFAADVSVDGEPCSKPIDLAKIEAGGDFPICGWRPGRSVDSGVLHVVVTVKATLAKDMLCALEARKREKDGKPPPAGVAGAKVVYADGGPARILKHGDQLLVASFCREVTWSNVDADADALAAWDVTSKAGLEEAQTKALFALLEPDIKGFFARWATFDPEEPGTVVETFSFDVFRTGEIFGAYESGPDGQVPLSNVVDVESDISFSSSYESGYCPDTQHLPFHYTVGVVGNDDAAVAITPKPMEHCEFVLPLDLTKLAGKRLRVRALYDVDGGQTMVLYEREFTAHTLGFSWSAPVVTEVRAVANGWSKDEFRAQSSLPLSWAIGLGNAGNGVALTIPAKITYATRKNPNLSEMFSFYPHLSVIVTESDEGKTPVTLAAGVGFSLVNSFFFSYGLGFSGTHDGDHFVLIGLDIKDLAGLKPSF